MNLFIQQLSVAYLYLSIFLLTMCQVPGPERADGRRGGYVILFQYELIHSGLQ